MADASTWIVHVAAEAGDDVDVEMHDRLAGGRACVEADVVAIGVQLGVERLLDLVDEGEDCGSILVRGGEPIGDDALGDDERVAFCDRVLVADREGEIVLSNPLRSRDAGERALHRGARICQKQGRRSSAPTLVRITPFA